MRLEQPCPLCLQVATHQLVADFAPHRLATHAAKRRRGLDSAAGRPRALCAEALVAPKADPPGGGSGSSKLVRGADVPRAMAPQPRLEDPSGGGGCVGRVEAAARALAVETVDLGACDVDGDAATLGRPTVGVRGSARPWLRRAHCRHVAMQVPGRAAGGVESS